MTFLFCGIDLPFCVGLSLIDLILFSSHLLPVLLCRILCPHELITYGMATQKPTSLKEPITIRSYTLTPPTVARLQQMRRDATDYIGRGVSNSAVVRALILHASQQSPTWVREIVFPLIEEEIRAGRRWGKQRVNNV
jgi:hypothetical protein